VFWKRNRPLLSVFILTDYANGTGLGGECQKFFRGYQVTESGRAIRDFKSFSGFAGAAIQV
jgi:hypothetical protein